MPGRSADPAAKDFPKWQARTRLGQVTASSKSTQKRFVLSAQHTGRLERLRALQSLPPLPTVLLGHSVGGLVAYEVARLMQSLGATPDLLLVSAKPRPQVPATLANLAHLPNERFLREVDELYGGIPKELKAVPELLEMMLPIIRADIAASESYRHTPGPRLRCPILVCHGLDDHAVDPARLSAWGELTDCELELQGFPGGHFYLYEPASGFLAALRERLARRLAPAVGGGNG